MSFFNNLVGSLNSVVDSVVDDFPVIQANRKHFRITKILGEGGFSFVYLAEDDNKQLYAVKAIRCKEKQVAKNAIKEALVTDRFQHENIIKIVDMCMIKEEDGSKTAYIIMPFYKRGNIQDWIERNHQTGKRIPEKQLLNLFKSICSSVQVLVHYRNKLGQNIPYAHRDIKPANVLISDNGQPILMDFGSCRPARIHIDDRKSATQQQDDAAEHCSMPYRAPELFDVKPGTMLDEKVDVWSLGCTLFAMAYGASPFEMTVAQQGGTMTLAVLNRQFYFPKDTMYSKQLEAFIDWMLTTDPHTRPSIDQVIHKLE
ncbi:kinase-like domain-containing protein [Gilbertella persicaria]|uniref:kinase-like domain-containing protein n=1 Tax=Gilbertella persicaria TaxID=101096 RepID=UPI0022212755|nr:kinase-like domain-containing protein [Gilbertella persicaria]KAI8073484.1 kinase-like domain-containing protein [Gilbertella persicaria]